MLVAPAGFGKTTLALDYLTATDLWQTGEAAAWLSLDLGGIIKWDTRIFFQALTLSLKNALPGLDFSYIERELEQIPSGQEISEELAAGFIFAVSNAIAAQPRPLILVIDDYHLVCDEKSVRDARLVNDIVNALLVTAPAHFRMLICSRTYPVLDVLKLSMDDELIVLTKNQLKFTGEEIAEFLQQRGKDSTLAEQITRESEGWAAAVALKMQNLDLEAHLQDQNIGAALAASSRYSILAEEMLKQLDRDLRRLLEACSILEYGISLPLAYHLLETYQAGSRALQAPEVETILRKLENSGLLELHKPMPLAEGDPAETTPLYRLHNLLKDYLEKNLDAAVGQELNLAACRAYRENGEWALAFEHALKANNHPLAAEILEERAYEQFKTSRLTDIEARVARLEETALAAHPHLLLVAGMASSNAGRTEKSLSYFHAANRRWGRYEPLDRLVYGDDFENNSAYTGATEELEPSRLLNKSETIVCMAKIWEVMGRQTKAIAALEGVRNLLTALASPLDERHQHVLGFALRHLGNCYRLVGRLNESIEETTRALNLFSTIDEGYNVAACRHNLGIAWRQLGNQSRAERNFRQALEYWERHGNAFHQATTLNSLSVSLLNEGRYKEAIELLQVALEKARESGSDSIIHYLLAGLGDAYLGLRDKAKALSYYTQAASEATRTNNYEMLTYARLAAARALRRAGELAQARQAILSAVEYAEESTDGDRAAAAVENGAYQLLSGRIELAQAQLEGALALAHKVQAKQTEALAHFWLSYLHVKAGRFKLAYDHMRRAINLAQDLGYDTFLHEEATELPLLSEHFQTAATVSDPVGGFFARGDDYAADPATKVELRAFGKGRIFRGGQEVASVSRKARELIFFLSEQKVPVSGERIYEALWPETLLAGHGLGSAFYSTITLARRALGNPETIRAADGCYSLNLRYRYDVEQFEEAVERAETLAEVDSQIQQLKLALDFFTDAFLADTDNEWAEPRRAELIEKKQNAMRMLARAYQQLGQREKAMEIWLQLYTSDIFDERALRYYVELLAETKSKTIGLNFLRRKMEELTREGIEPEEATQQLYDQLDSARSITKRRK